MSVTREEMITNLEKLAALFYTESEQNKMVDYSKIIETLEFAAAALRPVSREQVEKVWRGEWKPTEVPYMNECEDCSVCGYRTAWGHGFRFCPHCGAPMTDEAAEMVMERMEKLYETI